MKYLITGITGFAAPHLAQYLISQGHEVYGVTRKIPRDYDAYYDKVKMYEGDLSIGINNILKLERFDGVFHLGGFTHPPTSFKKPQLAFKTNAVGTIKLIEGIKKYQTTNCIFMQCSTPEVYGICPSDKSINEDTPLKPMNPYGVSKAAADMYVLEQIRNGNIKGFITRAFSHTGPRRKSNYSISSDAIQIAKILKGLQEPIIKVGNLECQRAVTDVRDVVRAYSMLMNKHINGEIYHISTDEIHTIGFYLNKMVELFNVKAKTSISRKLYRPIDIPIQIPNCDKLKREINWIPEIPIEQTLTDLVNYWMEKL